MLRCEVRPGPEFLTRSYTFHSNRHFQALQHYYTESSCEDPAYSLIIRGKIRLLQASWITLGATEADHHLSRVGIVLHSVAAKQRLASRLPSACVSLSINEMVLGKPYELYNTRAGRACLAAMGFSVAEMGLVRVEKQHHSHGGEVQELFLGDIHTDWAQRTQHRPTGYQQPLQNAMVRIPLGDYCYDQGEEIIDDFNKVQRADQLVCNGLQYQTFQMTKDFFGDRDLALKNTKKGHVT